MNEAQQKGKISERTVGKLEAILYGIGCGIGGSIFVLLGTGINQAGPGVLISLILGSVLILLTALNYSELSTSLPISGGAYNFSKEGLGGFSAFIIGFFLWIANIATCAFSAQAFALVIQVFFPLLIPLELPIAISLILFIAFVVFRTQKLALKTLIGLTVVLISIFSVFIFSGILIAPNTNLAGYNPTYIYSPIDVFNIIQMFAVLFIFFTSITSNLAYLNSDIKNPSKNILKINLIAIFLTSAIYLLVSFVVLINFGNLTEEQINSPVLLAIILNNILGPLGFFVMGVASLLATLIAINAALGSAVAVFHALVRDNYIHEKLKKVNERNVPTLVLIITTSVAIFITIIAIIFGNIGFTAEITAFIYFFGLAFVNFAAVRLRYKRKELDRPYKAPFFPYLPIIVGSSCLILAFVLEPRAIILGLIISLIGLGYYLLTLADRHSIILTLAGIKFFCLIIIGFFIWVINNFSITSSIILGLEFIFHDVFLRILIFIGALTICTVFLDIVPLREIILFFIKKIDKEKVAISIGTAQIVELDKPKLKLISNVNYFIGVTQIFSSVFLFILSFIIGFDFFSIDNITIGNTIITEKAGEYLFIAVLVLFGGSLFFSGLIYLYLNREIKSLGI